MLAERANQITHRKDISVLDTLSAAYAEDERFDDAIQTEREALSQTSPQTDPELTARLKAHLQNYLSGKPLRETTDGATL